MYKILVHFVGLGANEGVNEELLKTVPDYQAALKFLQSVSAQINGERVLAGVEIKYKGVS